MSAAQLIDEEFWDDYWSAISLPREMTKSQGLYVGEILSVFDRFLPHGPLSALEVGGAPGQYAAYLHRTFGYEIHVLELSRVGCEKTTLNFELLGIPGVVHRGDLFSDDLALPRFDVVYSLGLIEHFPDTIEVVRRHLRLLEPGGVLIVGCPNFRGINGMFLRHLAPKVYAAHDLQVMDIGRWNEFERRFRLERLFRGYVGGFEPRVFARTEARTPGKRVVARGARIMSSALNRDRSRFLRRFNSVLWSGYVMGAYRTPLDRPSFRVEAQTGIPAEAARRQGPVR